MWMQYNRVEFEAGAGDAVKNLAEDFIPEKLDMHGGSQGSTVAIRCLVRLSRYASGCARRSLHRMKRVLKAYDCVCMPEWPADYCYRPGTSKLEWIATTFTNASITRQPSAQEQMHAWRLTLGTAPSSFSAAPRRSAALDKHAPTYACPLQIQMGRTL
jgi:hypothetical protein